MSSVLLTLSQISCAAKKNSCENDIVFFNHNSATFLVIFVMQMMVFFNNYACVYLKYVFSRNLKLKFQNGNGNENEKAAPAIS